jgi:S1-C subfamily serine protease/tetratricopeptide (TPR) repeat protein
MRSSTYQGRLVLAWLVVLLLLSGCTTLTYEDDSLSLFQTKVREIAAAIPEKQVHTTTPIVFPLHSMSESEPLSAREIFARVSPAVVYINTPAATGSGVLVKPGYLVTSAHVVWPFTAVSVTFPSGAEYDTVPVLAWDLIADLAILALPDTEVAPLAFVDGSDLAIGSQIYLIGYPGEVERTPQPTLTQGLLSRVRTWTSIDLTLFQLDAKVSGGQSGGVLVTEQGEVIGISGFYFSSAQYGLAISAANITPRLEALLNEESVAFNDRHPLRHAGERVHTGVLESSVAYDLYFLNAAPGSKVELRVEGNSTPSFEVFDLNGETITQSKEKGNNTHTASVTIETGAPYLVAVEQASENRNHYRLTSSHPLQAIEDPEDGTIVAVGETLSGSLDAPMDHDIFTIQLRAGERIDIEMDSITVDPYMLLFYKSPTQEETAADDDSSPSGLFGLSARIVYEAPADGDYMLVVFDATQTAQGGYFLKITEAQASTPTTKLVQSRRKYFSRYGGLWQYESQEYGFTIRYPEGFKESQCQLTACFSADSGVFLAIAEENVQDLPLLDKSLNGYVEDRLDLMNSSQTYAQLISRTPFTTPQGFIGEILHYSARNDLVNVREFIYLNPDGIVFTMTYVTRAKITAEAEQLFDFTFSTFRIWDEEKLAEDPIYHLDEGTHLNGLRQYEAALDAFSQAIALAPDLVEAYLWRSVSYKLLGDYNRSLADLNEVIALSPDEIKYLRERALLYWQMGKDVEALEDADRAIEANPEDTGLYNNRALFRATAGDFAGALADLEEVALLAKGKLPPYILDTRAYVYLKQQDYPAARADYDAALAQDYQNAYTLLGAGISYARVGETEEAETLLGRGMALLEGIEHLNPQLADLVAWAEEIMNQER